MNALKEYEKIQNAVEENKDFIGKKAVIVSFTPDYYLNGRGVINLFTSSTISNVTYSDGLQYQFSSGGKISFNEINKTLYLYDYELRKFLENLLVHKKELSIDDTNISCNAISLENISLNKNILDNLNNLDKNLAVFRLSNTTYSNLRLYCVQIKKLTERGIYFSDDSIVSNPTPSSLLEKGYYALDDIGILINDIIERLYSDNLKIKSNNDFSHNNNSPKDNKCKSTNDLDKIIESKIKEIILSDTFVDKLAKSMLNILKAKL